MPAYLVTLDTETGGHNLIGGGDAMVVFATNATAAKEICAAKYNGDGSCWADDSTVTEIIADADFNGWTFEVELYSGFGTGGDEPASVSVTGDATTNTIDEIGAALVIQLNALSGVANAAYNSSTQVLTVTGTSDALGAINIGMNVIPPNGTSSIASLVGTIVDNGTGGTAATGTLTGTTIAADDTVTIDELTYTFVSALSEDSGDAVPGEVLVGVSDSASLDNLIAAINGAAGEGTTYGTGTVDSPVVTAAAGDGDTMVVTADVGGDTGNEIATTASLTSGDWGAAVLAGGDSDAGPTSVVLPGDADVYPMVTAVLKQV